MPITSNVGLRTKRIKLQVVVSTLVVLLLAAGLHAQNKTAQSKKKVVYKPQVNEISNENSKLLDKLIHKHPRFFKKVIKHQDKYRVQIIFTQINRDKRNRPWVKHHTYRLRNDEFFFAASMVKLPTVAMALEKINSLAREGFTKFSKMVVGRDRPCQYSTQRSEYSKKYNFANILHYIKDVFLVSGNVSYDRLYEFVGQKKLNEKLHSKGYTSCQITQRYGHYCPIPENRYTNPMRFFNGDTLVFKQKRLKNSRILENSIPNMKIGKGYYERGKFVKGPKDFSQSNFVSLKDLHEILMAIVIPQVMPKGKKFKLTRDDYKTMHKYMSMYPTKSTDPVYNKRFYTTTRMKYLLYGGGIINKPFQNVRIFNKVGMAYGFLTDCAYIVDFENGVEFVLSATLMVNDNEIFSDSRYEYYSIGLPFFQHLGEEVYELEKRRKKRRKPRLDFYKHDYTVY